MSRFEWDDFGYDGPEFMNAGEFFDTRARWAIFGRRGRKALLELREALMALPRHELIEGAMRRGPRVVDDEEADDELFRPYKETLPEAWLSQPKPAPDPVPMAPGQLAFFEQVPEARSTALTGVDPTEGYRVCAVGAFCWYQNVKSGMDPVAAFEAVPALETEDDRGDGDEMFQTAHAGRRAGLTYALAWELASGNDETFARATPAERWQKFMGWIDFVLATPVPKRGQMPPERLGRSWSG